MQFLTIRKPGQHRYRGPSSLRRDLWFNSFWYDLNDDPFTEGLSVRLGPDFGKSCPREFWHDIEIGARAGWESAQRQNKRLCSVNFTMVYAHYHDVETTSHAVQLHVKRCVQGDVTYLAEPVPLHTDWLTTDVLALARGIHANAALDGLPALCDALLEAGCDDPLVIRHLQTCPDHTRRVAGWWK